MFTMSACGQGSSPGPATSGSIEVKELSSAPQGSLPSHLTLTPPAEHSHGDVQGGSKFIIEFAPESDAARAITDVPNGNPYVALPQDVQQALERVTEESGCPIADTLSVGSRMRLSVTCAPDEQKINELQQKLSTVPQVKFVEPEIIATHQ